MSYWSWWQGGLALAGVVLLHWFVLGRQMAVSGRFTVLVNRLRFGTPQETEDMGTDAEMIAAMQAATEEAFGDEALSDEALSNEALSNEASVVPVPLEKPLAPILPSQGLSTHLVFLLSLSAGGLLSALTSQDGVSLVESGLRGSGFSEKFGEGGVAPALVLVVGGILVGFGTRMSSGCTSGHGLCGVSRATPGGLLATACFFGTGIAASLLLGYL